MKNCPGLIFRAYSSTFIKEASGKGGGVCIEHRTGLRFQKRMSCWCTGCKELLSKLDEEKIFNNEINISMTKLKAKQYYKLVIRNDEIKFSEVLING